MAAVLQKVCENAKQLYGMKLEAGKEGLSNIVKWVHTMESEEAAKFLHGGELVFTTGIGNAGEAWLCGFARQLHKCGACGMVVNLGPYIVSLPESLRSYCNENRFPLFTVPWETRLVDMTRDFCNCIIQEEKAEESIVEVLKNLMVWPEKFAEYASVLERNDFSVREEYMVLCLRILPVAEKLPGQYEEFVRMQIEQLLYRENCKFAAFQKEKDWVFVLSGFGRRRTGRMIDSIMELQKKKETSVRFLIGAGPAGRGLEMIGDSCAKARRILSLCEKCRKSVLFYDDLDFEKVILGVSDENILREYYEQILGRLESYDSEYHTEYRRTLYVYLKNDCSIRKTAEELYVHRNTINYQINRIKKILGRDFATLDEKMKLLTAFVIGELLFQTR